MIDPIAPVIDLDREIVLMHYTEGQVADKNKTGIYYLEEVRALLELNLVTRERFEAHAFLGQSNIRDHMLYEIDLLRRIDRNNPDYNASDAEYDERTYDAVRDLIEVFVAQQHSGFSANQVLTMFERLANFKNVAPLTDRPNEWIEVGDNVWQSTRSSDCFSNDGGVTYYSIYKGTWLEGLGFSFIKKLPMRWRFKHYKSLHTDAQYMRQTGPIDVVA